MLKIDRNLEIPEEMKAVSNEAFPNGNSYLKLRDEVGSIFHVCMHNKNI
jgi:hypothetical protein